MGSRLEANSRSVRKRIENHAFDDEDGEEYEGSAFGGFGDYFRRKKIKLQNLDADVRARSDKPKIFKNIVAHVNGYTQPSLQDLHHLIVQHGGGFMQYLDGKTVVTHIIASSLTPKKAVEFRKYRIVKPAWVVDSIQAGKLLPWNDYRVVDEGETQKVLAFGGGMITSQANVKARGYRDQTDSSYYTHQLKGSQSGSPASPAGTPNSSAAIRSRFSKQRLPTPEDAIEDMLPCHQPELRASDKEGTPDKIDSPPKASSYLAPQEDGKDVVPTRETLQNADGNLYDNTTPPNAQQEPSLSLESEERLDDISAEEQASSTTKKRPLTAEEHNAILLSDPKMRKSTVVDPNFLEQYYRESRLHHLSTWKAELKSELQAMANEKSASQRAKQKPPAGTRRYVMHIDFDSFFAAVSLQKHPEFKDKPAVVAHGNGNGSEIASCNYPARQFGIKNGMWMRRAHELCPDLKILPYDFPAYEAASRDFYRAIIATDGVVQSVSIDEALIDVSNLCIAAGGSDGRQMSEGSIYREQAKADEIAQSLRDQVKAKTDCNVSVGIGANILQAKVALRKAKPAGQYQLKPEEVLDFMGQLQVQDLPGVAWSTGGKLEELGVKYVKDLRELSKQRLVQAMGPKTGEKLWEYSRGIDRQEVGEQVVRKSVSAEVNWGVRFATQEQAEEFIGSICGELEKRLLKEKVKGKQFTIKIMRRSVDAPLDPPKHLGHGKCDTFNKSVSLGVATNSRETLTREALAVLRGFGFSPGELRGIGVQMTKLEPMKFTTDGTLEGSQRRLQFKATTAQPTHSHAAPKVFDVDPIQDDPETPKKFKVIESIEDRPISFGAKELNQSTPSRRPLNMLGTQFILPSQVDPEVLAELPNDIRSKLLRQVRQSSPTPAPHSSFKAAAVPFALTALPAQSQLDPEILAALPADVRAEVLAQYAAGATPSSPSHRSRVSDQTVLPQSPRKNRVIGVPIKKPAPPVKRGRGRPPKSAQLAAAAAATTTTKSGNTLTQANFISVRNPARDAASREASADPNNTPSDAPPTVNDAEPDPEFLAALPEDLRREVIEEHKRKKLQASRLAISRKQKQSAAAQPSAARPVQTIKVPRPPRPTFTTQKLSTERDLRAAIKEWVLEFAEEGPYAEDVGALVKYLGKVVGEERDLGKAVGVVRWLEWVVGDAGESEDKDKRFEFEREKWGDAVVRVKKGVCGAAGGKGLGLVNFD